MEGENNGTQAQQGTQQQESQQQAAQQPQQAQQQAAQSSGEPAGDIGGTTGTGAKADSATYEAQLAERDKRISELEAQIADAAKTAEATEALKGEIAELKAQGEPPQHFTDSKRRETPVADPATPRGDKVMARVAAQLVKPQPLPTGWTSQCNRRESRPWHQSCNRMR